jgi:hypothetical protein
LEHKNCNRADGEKRKWNVKCVWNSFCSIIGAVGSLMLF